MSFTTLSYEKKNREKNAIDFHFFPSFFPGLFVLRRVALAADAVVDRGPAPPVHPPAPRPHPALLARPPHPRLVGDLGPHRIILHFDLVRKRGQSKSPENDRGMARPFWLFT